MNPKKRARQLTHDLRVTALRGELLLWHHLATAYTDGTPTPASTIGGLLWRLAQQHF